MDYTRTERDSLTKPAEQGECPASLTVLNETLSRAENRLARALVGLRGNTPTSGMEACASDPSILSQIRSANAYAADLERMADEILKLVGGY